MARVAVTWTHRHGYATDVSWVETAPDEQLSGEAIAWVSTPGGTVAVVVVYGSHELVEVALDELTVTQVSG